ncbi:MAG: hypothetical protein ABEL51_13470 [Salinibacter sp.]
MWTLDKLQKHFSLSQQQLYRRLRAAEELLEPHMQRGEKNAIELDEGGFRILQSVIELDKQGRTLTNAVEETKQAMTNGSAEASADESVDDQGDNHDKLSETQYRSLIEQIGYLKGQLEMKDHLLGEIKTERDRLREENADLQRKAALVEYRETKRWWQFWK